MTVLLVGGAPATLESVLAAVRDEGFAAYGTTVLTEASAELSSGRITALIIGGGIGDSTREELREKARTTGIPVVESGLRGRDAVSYVREDLAPRLREIHGASSGEDSVARRWSDA